MSSIYEENPSDPKIEIPANKFMFENIIRDVYDIEDSSEEEEGFNDFKTQKEWYRKIMQLYEEKNPVKAGRIFEPSQSKINKLDCID